MVVLLSCKWQTIVPSFLKGNTDVIMDVFSYYGVCVLMECSCLHSVVLLWHNTLRSPSCVLATEDIRTSFLVSAIKNLI